MFVTKNVPFQVQFDLPYGLAAVVRNVHIHVYAGPADPYLPVQASRQANNINSSISWFKPFIRSCERTRKRHEGFLGCALVSEIDSWRVRLTVIYRQDCNVF